MIDHMTLKVSDPRKSIEFYSKALAPLNYVPKAHHEPTIGFGVDDGTPHSDFYVSPVEHGETPVPTHIAFLAPDRQAVRGFYNAALDAGGTDNGAPGPRPYHEGYWSAFVLDPDGNNVEAVVNWAGYDMPDTDMPDTDMPDTTITQETPGSSDDTGTPGVHA